MPKFGKKKSSKEGRKPKRELQHLIPTDFSATSESENELEAIPTAPDPNSTTAPNQSPLKRTNTIYHDAKENPYSTTSSNHGPLKRSETFYHDARETLTDPATMPPPPYTEDELFPGPDPFTQDWPESDEEIVMNPNHDPEDPEQEDNENSNHTIVEFVDIAQVSHLINTHIEVVTDRDDSIDGTLLKIESNNDTGYILMKNVNYNNKYANSMQINLNQVVTMRPYQPFTTVERSKKSPQTSQSLLADLRPQGASAMEPRKCTSNEDCSCTWGEEKHPIFPHVCKNPCKWCAPKDSRKTVSEPNDSLDYANPLDYHKKKYEQNYPQPPQPLYPDLSDARFLTDSEDPYARPVTSMSNALSGERMEDGIEKLRDENIFHMSMDATMLSPPDSISPQNKSQATSTIGSSVEETIVDNEKASNFITDMKAKMSALYSLYGPNLDRSELTRNILLACNNADMDHDEEKVKKLKMPVDLNLTSSTGIAALYRFISTHASKSPRKQWALLTKKGFSDPALFEEAKVDWLKGVNKLINENKFTTQITPDVLSTFIRKASKDLDIKFSKSMIKLAVKEIPEGLPHPKSLNHIWHKLVTDPLSKVPMTWNKAMKEAYQREYYPPRGFYSPGAPSELKNEYLDASSDPLPTPTTMSPPTMVEQREAKNVFIDSLATNGTAIHQTLATLLP